MSRKITIIIEDDGTAQGLGVQDFNFPDTSGYGWNHQYRDPCQFCQNNPAVNPRATGICNCALPALANPVYC